MENVSCFPKDYERWSQHAYMSYDLMIFQKYFIVYFIRFSYLLGCLTNKKYTIHLTPIITSVPTIDRNLNWYDQPTYTDALLVYSMLKT